MRALQQFGARIWQDFAALRNIDAYVVVVFAVLFVVLNLFDDLVPDRFVLLVILSGIAVLVLRQTAPPPPPDLDQVLHDRSAFREPFSRSIAGAKELWFAAPTGTNTLRSAMPELRDILRGGGAVRVLLQDETCAEGLAVLNATLDETTVFKNDLQAVEDELQRLMDTPDAHARFTWGDAPYFSGYSLVIINPHGPDGRVIVEFFGYKLDDIRKRMHLDFTKRQSSRWFEFWVDQFERQWQAAQEHQAARTRADAAASAAPSGL